MIAGLKEEKYFNIDLLIHCLHYFTAVGSE